MYNAGHDINYLVMCTSTAGRVRRLHGIDICSAAVSGNVRALTKATGAASARVSGIWPPEH